MLSPEDLEAADAAFDAFGLIQEDWGRVYPGFGVVQFPELELDESDEGLTPLVVLVKREGTVPPSSQGVGAGGGNFALASPARPSPPRASLTSGQGPMVRERVSPTVDPTNVSRMDMCSPYIALGTIDSQAVNVALLAQWLKSQLITLFPS